MTVIATDEPTHADITGFIAQANVDGGKQAGLVCTGCHSVDGSGAQKIGPSLWNVIDRPIGDVDGFDYSDALAAVNSQWDYNTVNRFLTNPAAFAPGTKMMYPGIPDEATRVNIIAWLRRLSNNPVGIPEASATESLITTITSDPFGSDWPDGNMREVTGAACIVCHSLAIVKQQGLSKGDWDELLVWMVEEQGMSEIEEPERTGVVDYLATHFGIP